MKILRITLKVLSTIILAFILYIATYNIIFALPKNIDALELNYENTISDLILNETNYESERDTANEFIEGISEEGFLQRDEVRLAYSKYLLTDSKASIVISHGYTENKDKYEEMIYYYLKSGYSVFIMDHRGHGKSTREVSDNSLVYIDSFDTYVDDLHSFITEIVKPSSSDNKIILFGHSMGGGIASRLAEVYPDSIDLLILSAPMIKPNLGLDEAIAYPIVKAMMLINKYAYVIGNDAYDPNYQYDLEEASTSSEARSYYAYTRYNRDYNQLWGASYSWVNAVIDGTHEIQKIENIEKISVPVLLFQAGADTLVMNDAQNKLAKYCNDITMYKVSSSKHEIWNETNNILVAYYKTIFDFIDLRINNA